MVDKFQPGIERQTELRLKEPDKPWGGPWTEKKLEAFEAYVRSYLKIMKSQPYWKTIYFDGFAGSGTRMLKRGYNVDFLQLSNEEKFAYKGAAERVVRMTEPDVFDYYYFIEKSKKRLEQLKTKLEQVPESKTKTLAFRAGDCNQELQKLGKTLKSRRFAALVFLDPFGMQIEWKSIAALEGTRCDIWLLLPTAVVINRLLDRKGKLKNIKRLERFFGLTAEQVRDYFYRSTGQTSLFPDEPDDVRKVLDPITRIAQLYVSQLKHVWRYVTETPLRLDNRRGAPLFHFVFASNNRTALKIAAHIIQKRG